MKTSSIIVVAIVAVAVIVPAMLVWGNYNGLVSAEIGVEEKWAQVQVQYQRRFDLIPRVVNATKLYINYEQDLLTDIAEARSGWTDSLNGDLDDQIAANGEVDSILGRLMAVVIIEDYPELKGDEVVLSLIDELEGTENRIEVARLMYNEAVTVYNKRVRLFPGSIVAGMFGFESKPYYQAQEGSDEAPNVPI